MKLFLGNRNLHWKPHSTPKTILRSSTSVRALLTGFRIDDVESQIGGGLIEEVIQVAEGELKLVGSMSESKV